MAPISSSSSSSSVTFSSILIAQTLGLTSAAFLSGHILLTTPRQPTSSSSTPSSRQSISPTTTISYIPTTATTNALLSLISISSFTFLSSKYFMTLNQRKSELYALAALTIGAVGLGPEVWTWVQRYGRVGVEGGDGRAGVEGGDERPEKEGDGKDAVEDGVQGRVEGEERKEQTWDLVRGLLVFGGGVGAGGWAVWG